MKRLGGVQISVGQCKLFFVGEAAMHHDTATTIATSHGSVTDIGFGVRYGRGADIHDGDFRGMSGVANVLCYGRNRSTSFAFKLPMTYAEKSVFRPSDNNARPLTSSTINSICSTEHDEND